MAEGLRGWVNEHRRGVRTTAATVALLSGLAVAGCGGDSGSGQEGRQNTPAASSSESGKPGFGGKPECDFAKGDKVRLDQAMWVEAGVAEVSGGDANIGRLRYLAGGNKLAVVEGVRTEPRKTLEQRLAGGFAIGQAIDKAKITFHRRGSVDPGNDACIPKPGDPEAQRPAPSAQLVTATGTVNERASGETYPSFNDGPHEAGSPLAAYEAGGVGIRFTGVPVGFK